MFVRRLVPRERAVALGARKFVDLRYRNRDPVGDRLQPPPRVGVGREPRMSRVDDEERGFRVAIFLPIPVRLPLEPEIDPCDLVERTRRLGSATCKTVARQIDQIEWRAAAAADAIDVGEPRLAGRAAGACDALPDERVDQARFPDVRAPDERDLRESISRQIRSRRGASNESGLDLQCVIVSSAISTGSACSAAGKRPASGSASAILRTSSIVWTM
jgi:hypothetical protein